MSRQAYEHLMEQRLRDLSFQIECVKTRLVESPDHRVKSVLAEQLRALETRRDLVSEKLTALEGEPDGTWEELKLELEDEWDALIQDFEERVSSVA